MTYTRRITCYVRRGDGFYYELARGVVETLLACRVDARLVVRDCPKHAAATCWHGSGPVERTDPRVVEMVSEVLVMVANRLGAADWRPVSYDEIVATRKITARR